MGALTILKAAGLQTAHNPFSGVSPGGMAVAKNVVVFSNGVIEPRRGFKQLSYTYSAPVTSVSNSGGFFGTTLLVHSNTGTLAYDTGSAFTAYSGTFTPVDDDLLRMKFVEAKSNLYFNTNEGLKTLTSASGTPSDPLYLRAPRWDLEDGTECAFTGGTGWFPTANQCAFRMTYAYTASDGTEYESAPSDRIVLINASGNSQALDLAWLGDASVTAGTTYLRFYRTEASGGAATDPGDEMFLFAELPAEAGADDTVGVGNAYTFGQDPGLSARGLYTNARNGGGIGYANTYPPKAKDIVWHADRLWFANTTAPHRMTLELLGVGSPDGMQDADSITIAGATLTGETGAVAGAEFAIYTAGIPSEDLRRTTRNLVSRINDSTASGQTAVRASHISGPNDTPGLILLEATALDASAFTVYASRAASWNPELPTTSGAAISSTAERLPHGLFYSKPDQPESVPLLNYLLIGAKNKEILRVLPLREKLYVFKEDGIFTVAGEEPFTVDCLDATTRLVAPDTAVVLNNQILCFSNQGVVSVSDGGVQVLSRGIEDALLPYLNASQRSTIKRYAFGVAHETDRTYELWFPSPGVSDSRMCNRAYVFNTMTSTWTTWDGSEKNWAAVSTNDVRYYGSTDGKVLKERRDYASSDYADETIAVTVTDDSDSTLTLTSTAGISVGDAFVVTKDSVTQSETITAVGASTITLDAAIVGSLLTGGTTVVDKAFECDVVWLPVAYDRPGSLKRFQQGTLHFKQPTAFTTALATYATELSSADSTESAAFSTVGWGDGAWGDAAWGDPTKNFNARHVIPLEKQRAAMLYPGFRITEARSRWKLMGLTLETEETSERNSNGDAS